MTHEQEEEDAGNLKEPLHINQVSESSPAPGERSRRKESEQCASDHLRLAHL